MCVAFLFVKLERCSSIANRNLLQCILYAHKAVYIGGLWYVEC